MNTLVVKNKYVTPSVDVVIIETLELLNGSLIPPGENTDWEDEA